MGIFSRKPQLASPNQRQRNTWFLLSVIIVLVVSLAGFGSLWFYTGGTFSFAKGSQADSTPTRGSVANGIGVTNAPDGELIGISDGTYAFDTDRPDGILKLQAADAFKNRNIANAQSLWKQALVQETNDAEALIYMEDQRILTSHDPYITFVVGTMLTGGASNISTGRDNLQGAYVAQKEYNDGFKLNGGRKVRLLIANAGSQPQYAITVAQQIVNVAKQDRSILGVMGWSFSAYALNVVEVLSPAHIPMLSSTASSDELTGRSPFFFRVAPSNKSQAIAGAQYAEHVFHATRAALFVDSHNTYSNSLADDFKKQFTADGNMIVATEPYTVGKPQTLPSLLQDALSNNPDIIYFAGYADDMGVLLTDFPTSNQSVQLMGGDALYELSGYPNSAAPNFHRLRFTAFAYPDEWDVLGYSSQKPPFFSEYASNFDPHLVHPGSYGYTRPDNNSMLSYDAMVALLQGCNKALAGGKNALTPDVLQQSLAGITGAKALQGVSGQISFGHDGDPINKAIVVLYIDPTGHIKLLENNGVQGCFLVGPCSNS